MVDAARAAGAIIVALIGLVYVIKSRALARWQKKHFGTSALWATKYLSEDEIAFLCRVGGLAFLISAAVILALAFK